jgi:AcrR family transcriptional regulator
MTDETIRQSRREQRRAQTVEEIKNLAMKQVATGGPDAVSLLGIAREMAMSPAAIYRYFDSRDALLGDLVVDAYNALADALEASSASTEAALERFVAVAESSREWALAHPNAYRLIFQTTIGSGQNLAAERTVPASSRSMRVLIEALVALVSGQAKQDVPAAPRDELRVVLDRELREWAERSGTTQVSTRVLEWGLVTWTRLHGMMSLELGGHLAATGVDPALIFRSEVQRIVHEVSASQID